MHGRRALGGGIGRARRTPSLGPVVRTVVLARYPDTRASLRTRLDDAVGVTVVGEATQGADLAPLLALRPEAVVIDLEATDAFAALDAAARLELPVVALGGEAPGSDLLANRGLPGWAYLARDADGDELAAAVRAAAAGLAVMERGAASRLAGPVTPTEKGEALSGREREVLQLIAEGLPNKQIALRLGISPHTAKFHVAGVLQKLGAASRTEAVSTGLRRGWVSL